MRRMVILPWPWWNWKAREPGAGKASSELVCRYPDVDSGSDASSGSYWNGGKGVSGSPVSLWKLTGPWCLGKGDERESLRWDGLEKWEMRDFIDSVGFGKRMIWLIFFQMCWLWTVRERSCEVFPGSLETDLSWTERLGGCRGHQLWWRLCVEPEENNEGAKTELELEKPWLKSVEGEENPVQERDRHLLFWGQ